MNIILPKPELDLPILRDLPAAAEFMYESGLYIKHDPSGAYYKCYSLNNKKWVSLGRSIPVRPVSITCDARF